MKRMKNYFVCQRCSRNLDLWCANRRVLRTTIFSEAGRNRLQSNREKTSPRPSPASADQTAKPRCGSTAAPCRAPAGDSPRRENESPRRSPCGRLRSHLHKQPSGRCQPRYSCHFSIISFSFSSASFSARASSRSLSPCDSRSST